MLHQLRRAVQYLPTLVSGQVTPVPERFSRGRHGRIDVSGRCLGNMADDCSRLRRIADLARSSVGEAPVADEKRIRRSEASARAGQ